MRQTVGVKSVTVASTAVMSLAAIVLFSYVGLERTGPLLVAAFCAVIVGVFSFTWTKISDLPASLSMGFVTLVAGLGAIVAALNAPPQQSLTYFAVFVVAGLALTFLVQLFRGTGAAQRLYSVTAGAAASFIAASTSGWVAVERLGTNDFNSPLTFLVGIGVVAAVLVCCIRWPDRIIAPLAIVTAALISGLAAIAFVSVPPWHAMVFSAVAAAITASCRAVFITEGGAETRSAAIAFGLTPIMMSGALVYFAERLVIG